MENKTGVPAEHGASEAKTPKIVITLDKLSNDLIYQLDAVGYDVDLEVTFRIHAKGQDITPESVAKTLGDPNLAHLMHQRGMFVSVPCVPIESVEEVEQS